MRQTGATVVTLRAGFSEAQLDEVSVQRDRLVLQRRRLFFEI